MQNDKKLYILNIPLNVTQQELRNALITLQSDIKVRLYQKRGESLGQGEITFTSSEDCINFVQQQKIKQFELYGQQIYFKPFIQKQNQNHGENAQETQNPQTQRYNTQQTTINEYSKKFKLVCHLSQQLQTKTEAELLRHFRKYCPQVQNVQRRHIIIDRSEVESCNAILSFNTQNNQNQEITPYTLIDSLTKAKITSQLLVGVEKDGKLENLRVIFRNLPVCSDEELVQWLLNISNAPIRHVKRSKGFCFATYFAEEDAVNVVLKQSLSFKGKTVIPDFTLDSMRLKYAHINQNMQNNQENKEDSYLYSYNSSSEEDCKSNENKVEIEEFDPKLGVEHYINKEDNKNIKEYSYSYDSQSEFSQQTDYCAEFDQKQNTEQLEQQNNETKEKSSKSDENTFFVQNIPKQLEISFLEGQRRLFEKEGINFKTNTELTEAAIRKSVCDLFRRFGRLKKISLPQDITGALRGFAFIQFEDDKSFSLVLEYISKLHQIARDVFGYKYNSDDLNNKSNQKCDNDTSVRIKNNMNILSKAQTTPSDEILKQMPQEQLKKIYDELALIVNVPRIHINLLDGSLQVFRTPLIVKPFLSKNELNEGKDARDSRDRRLDLLKFDLLIQGALSAAELEKRGIDENQQQQRMKLYKHMKERLEDVNNRMNPQRVQLRNFPVKITEETLLAHLWQRLVETAKLAWLASEEAQNQTTGNHNIKFSELQDKIDPKRPPEHLAQILKNPRLINLGKKLLYGVSGYENNQNEDKSEQTNIQKHQIESSGQSINQKKEQKAQSVEKSNEKQKQDPKTITDIMTTGNIAELRDCLNLRALRAGRTAGLQHELLRGFAQAKQQALKDIKSEAGITPLTGIAYADFDCESDAKDFIRLYNGARLFDGTKKGLIACFSMENNMREIKRDQKFGDKRKHQFKQGYIKKIHQNSRDGGQQMCEQNTELPASQPVLHKKLTRDKKRRLAKKLAKLQH